MASVRLQHQHPGKSIRKWSHLELGGRLLLFFHKPPSRCTIRYRHTNSESNRGTDLNSSNVADSVASLSRLHALTDEAIDHAKKSLQILKTRQRLQGRGEDFVSSSLSPNLLYLMLTYINSLSPTPL